ncbi:uncharacterized protein An07g03640 [Aspergillus niger]|uniref:Contig An07c0100, genomic contig n=2 Tax=Aspergillus niger TaxID=5061 RepID=A2QMX4_ASPNC|nr:uncharacterized protein An07g03640 [Aspergillus niger]CAK48115.1 unnamed protein product [Aspergillus niger]
MRGFYSRPNRHGHCLPFDSDILPGTRSEDGHEGVIEVMYHLNEREITGPQARNEVTERRTKLKWDTMLGVSMISNSTTMAGMSPRPYKAARYSEKDMRLLSNIRSHSRLL